MGTVRPSPRKRTWFASLALLATIALFTLSACGGAPAAEAPTSAPAAQPTTAAATDATAAPDATQAPPAEATAAPAELATSSEGTLIVWATGDENGANALQAAADLFVKENPGVTIRVQAVPWSDAHAKILSAAAAGVGPDIITGGMSWGIEFGKLGGMVDLKAKYPDLVAEVDTLALPQVKAATIPPSGEVYAVQYSVDMMAMFRRTDVIKDAPKTWEEFTKAIETAQAGGKKGFGQGWGNTDWLGYYNFLYSAGGTLYAADCSKATINSPEGVQAMTFYRDLYSKYKAPTDTNVDLEAGLESGDYPIGITGSWSAASLQFGKPQMAGQWAMSALPAGPSGKGISFLGGQVIGIMTGSKNQDTAAKFIRFLYTPAAVEATSAYKLSQNNYYVPPSLELLSAAKLPANLESAFKDLLTYSGGPPNCVGWEESQNDVNKLIQEVIFNSADPKEALDQAAQLMDQNLQN